MSRAANGTYTAPTNSVNPAVEGTAIDESDFNTLVDDIETALTDSLDRTGKGKITAHIDFDETTVSNPASNVGRLYGKDVGGVTSLFYKDSTGKDSNLLAAPVPSAASTLANGVNNNVSLTSGLNNKLRVSGPTGAFSITGLTAPTDNGTIAYIYNSTSQNMTLANESASSTAANRILTLTGSDVALTGVCVATLMYDTTDQRWLLIATQG